MAHAVDAVAQDLRATSEKKILKIRGRDRRQRLLLGAGFPLTLLALWQVLAMAGVIDQRFFPSPLRIITVAIDIIRTPSESMRIVSDVGATLTRVSAGYVIGSVAGVVLGALMGLYRPVRYAISPVLYAVFPTPKVAIFPLLIVIFGLGEGSKIALVTLGVFFMACINTLSGVTYANPIFRDVAKAYRMPLLVLWTRIILPSALPSIIAGLKLGIGQALILVVAAEFVSSDNGIGYYIWNSWQVLDIPRMFLGLVIVSLLGGGAIAISNAAERILIPWSKMR